MEIKSTSKRLHKHAMVTSMFVVGLLAITILAAAQIKTESNLSAIGESAGVNISGTNGAGVESRTPVTSLEN